MSCVSFLTPEQRARLGSVTCELSVEDVLAQHPMPPVTDGTLRRVRLMAASPDAAIRSAAASKYYVPADLASALASDADRAVRCAVARNPAAPGEVLRALARDLDPQVRGWVAANPSCPAELLESLAADADPTVTTVVAWARAW